MIDVADETRLRPVGAPCAVAVIDRVARAGRAKRRDVGHRAPIAICVASHVAGPNWGGVSGLREYVNLNCRRILGEHSEGDVRRIGVVVRTKPRHWAVPAGRCNAACHHHRARMQRDRVHRPYRQRGRPVRGDAEPAAGAPACIETAGECVAVHARAQAGLVRAGDPRELLTVDRHETLAADGECDLIVAVGPPVRDEIVAEGGVAKRDHVGDRRPAMLADPARTAGTGRNLDCGRRHAVRFGGRPVVTAGECVARHDLRVAVGPREHVRIGELVQVAFGEGQRITGPVTALGVVVVDEHDGVPRVEPSPRGADVTQVGEASRAERLAQLVPITELGDAAVARKGTRRKRACTVE